MATVPIRVVNRDAANPSLSQTSNSANFQVVQPTLSLSPSPVTVQALQSTTLTVTLSTPAFTGGVNVTLTSFAPLVATVNGGATATVSIPEGQTQGTASVEGVALDGGSTTITATAGGFVSAAAAVNVTAAPRINVSPATLLVGTARTATVTVGSTVAAPAGGILVTLVQSPSGFVSAPATVTIPAGATSVPVTVTGSAVGTTSLSGRATGFATGTACTVTVREVTIVLPGSTILSPGLSRPFQVSLTDPAPAGGTTVAFASSNTSVVDPPAPLLIPEGGTGGVAT
ncbi:MAG: hypothetical protein DMF78_08300, partial [Acidobacteria bacterium]